MPEYWVHHWVELFYSLSKKTEDNESDAEIEAENAEMPSVISEEGTEEVL